MNNYLNDKLKYFPRRVADYLEGAFARPITAKIHITNRCQYKCFYCNKKNDRAEINVDDRLLNRLKGLGVRSVILTGGEPLLHTKFNSLVYAMSDKFEVGVVTTLCEYNVCLQTEPQWVKVSLDTVDNNVYKKMKGLDNLDAVLENVRRLYKNKKEYVTLGVQAILCKYNDNIHQILDIYHTVKNMCDYFQIKPIESLELYPYTKNDYDMLNDLRKYEKIIVSDKFYFNKPQLSCPARWVHLVLDTDLDVVLCCSRTQEKIGNVFDTNILQKIHEYRFDFSKCYRRCVMSGYNDYLRKLHDGKHKNFI